MTPDFYYGEMLRWSFGFENPNKAAVIFACLIPLLWAGWLAGFRVRSGGWKLLMLTAAAISFLGVWGCLLLTYSRGGLVAAVLGIGIVSGWALLNRRDYAGSMRLSALRKPVSWLSGLLLLTVAVAGFAIGMGMRSIEVMGEDASVGNRLELWGAALQMAYENPGGFGGGRSGSEFAQWYQAVERTEDYRTMVNSYLTFLVERGWSLFAVLTLVVSSFLAWAWPEKDQLRAGWSVALWSSIVAFFVGGVFSTTMESGILWILPALALIGLILLKLLVGRALSVTSLRVGFAFGGAGLLMAGLFFVGKWKSTHDELERTFGLDEQGNTTVVAIRSKSAIKLNPLSILPDEAVLGPVWGKLVRTLALEAERDIRIIYSDNSVIAQYPILVVGDTVHRIPPKISGPMILLAPAISEGEIPLASKIILPEIDEDGRVAFWRERLDENREIPAQTIIILSGVGIRVEWAWEQVVKVLQEP